MYIKTTPEDEKELMKQPVFELPDSPGVLPRLSISLADAEQLLSLFTTCESADRHFHTCQSDLFRRFVCDAYKAQNVTKAFGKLKTALEDAKAAQTPQTDEKEE